MDNPMVTLPLPLSKPISCHLLPEIQLIILENADWKLQPILAQVCRFWRHFIKTSARVRLNRYFPVEATTNGFDASPGEAEHPRPRPWLHRSLTYLRQFVVDKTVSRDSFQPYTFRACKIELLQWPPPPRPPCRIWPDMRWHLFKDDPVTIFPGIDDSNLKIAHREIVVSFYCCSLCEDTMDKGNKVVVLGPKARVSSYLSFVTVQINLQMAECLKRWQQAREWDGGSCVVEFWMSRDPILVFSPIGFDTDSLRLWFKAKVQACDIFEY